MRKNNMTPEEKSEEMMLAIKLYKIKLAVPFFIVAFLFTALSIFLTYRCITDSVTLKEGFLTLTTIFILTIMMYVSAVLKIKQQPRDVSECRVVEKFYDEHTDSNGNIQQKFAVNIELPNGKIMKIKTNRITYNDLDVGETAACFFLGKKLHITVYNY